MTVLGPVVELLKDQPSGSVDLKSLQIQVSVKGHLHVDYIVQDNGQHQTQRLSTPVTSVQVTGCVHYSSLLTVTILEAYGRFLG